MFVDLCRGQKQQTVRLAFADLSVRGLVGCRVMDCKFSCPGWQAVECKGLQIWVSGLATSTTTLQASLQTGGSWTLAAADRQADDRM